MTEDTAPQRPVRVRTASERKKALDQYDDLRRSGQCESAVILCDMKDGSFQVLGQGRSLDEIGQSLLLGAQALSAATQQLNAPRFEPREEPAQRGVWNQSAPIPRKIRLDDKGELVPPDGENFISCGECAHPRWYVLHNNASDMPTRYSCAHCGNEIEVAKLDHEAGHA